MPVSAEETQRRVSKMTASLRDHGLRLTRQRSEIVREVAGTDEHPDVERIFLAVREHVPSVSIDTVYRTLATLAEIGLVARVSATAGPVRYDANVAGHHHFVCTRCGLVRDIEDDDLDDVRAPQAATSLGIVESTEVQFKGVCRECQGSTRL